MILSHLSPANSDWRASKDKRVLTVTGVVSPQNICSAKAKIGVVNGGGVCFCEDTKTGSSNSNSAFLVAKADREECDNGENESNTMGSCDARSNGSVLSQLARSPEIVNEDQNGCIFCEIIKGRAPAFKLYEDETCICILDDKPLSHGHSLVIPKSHFPSLEVTPPPVAAAMCAVIPILGSAIMEATRCECLEETPLFESRDLSSCRMYSRKVISSANLIIWASLRESKFLFSCIWLSN